MFPADETRDCVSELKVKSQEEEEASPKEEEIELSEDEKVVIDILKENSPSDLNELKTQAGLSNKNWDKAIKGLTKNKLARVEKTEAGLVVLLI